MKFQNYGLINHLGGNKMKKFEVVYIENKKLKLWRFQSALVYVHRIPLNQMLCSFETDISGVLRLVHEDSALPVVALLGGSLLHCIAKNIPRPPKR